MSPFVHLHVHSNYSLCRGANTIEQLCVAAKKNGMTHLALTDTNGLYGLVWFIQTARENGIQPLIGAYLDNDKNHCVMLATNMTGYQNICRAISSLHCQDDFDLGAFLCAHVPGVLTITDDVDLLSRLEQNHASDVYAELIPYKNRESVLHFAREHNLPVVATNAVYLIESADWQIHQLLRAIDLNSSLSRIPADELVPPHAFFKSSPTMSLSFPDCPEALENSLKIARQCTFDLDFHKFVFASYHGPNGEDAQTWLESRVREGIALRYGPMTDAIHQRLDYEMKIIIDKGFAPYFLVVADAVNRAPRTCGRGSAAASLVSYCLGISHVDPIKYDLFFDRFLNPGRQDPPDIDVDFPWDERDDILDFLFNKYGTANTAMISNHNSFKARSAVREVAKVYGIPESEIKVVTEKMSGYWQPDDLWGLTQTHPLYKTTELLPPWPEIFQLAEKIRGYPRHMSVHCGGVVIAPDGLDRYVPSQPAKKILNLKGVIQDGSTGLPRQGQGHFRVVQWEKDQAEDMGLIKIDILGNRSLSVIRDALLAVHRNYGVEINYTLWNPLDDPDTIRLLERGDSIGVFYVESPAMRQLQRKTCKGDFEHIVIHSSIIRPAANAYIHEYVRRLKGGTYESLHPLLEKILKETYGIMVYQEDVSKVVMALADFNAAEADDLRKVISKKHKQKQVLDYRVKFMNGAQRNGVDPGTCEKIWSMIMSFSGYSFCKPHSASFAMVSFKSAFLKAHYPAEFIAAVISNRGGYYSTFAYVSEAKRMGLRVLMPDVNHSDIHYLGKDKTVRIGLMQLKGLSHNAMKAVMDERTHNGAFRSFDDFLARTDIVPSDAILLIKAGCFDALEPHKSRPELLWRLKWHGAQKVTQPEGTLDLFDSRSVTPAKLPKPINYDETTLIRHEIETLGFLLSRHPLTLYKDRIKKLDFVKGKELINYTGQRVRTIGWMITRKTVSSKNEELMEFISFEDTTAIYETTFFPKAYQDFVHMLSSTRPYVLEGKVESHFGAVSLTVDKVALL
jgi:error-prone DNA polymerase